VVVVVGGWGGGVNNLSQELFYAFSNNNFGAFGSKKLCLKAGLGF
jgi:hypothetical protein